MMIRFYTRLGRLVPFILALAMLAGCAAPTQAPTSLPPSETPMPPPPQATATPLPPTATTTLTLTPTSTSPPPSPTATTTRTERPAATETATLTPTATRAAAQAPASDSGGQTAPGQPAASGSSVKIYFIQKNDTNGGCGDSVVPVGAGVNLTGDVSRDVAAGLKALFAAKWDYSGSLYNPLFRSNINVQHVEFDASNGLIQVWLTGNYKPSGDDCDNTRVKAQIWSTIRQSRDVKRTNIFLNDIPFGDRLSNDK